ncbi:MAG: zinc ribbon domain-containing protein [Myxococcota bacterium]
MREKLKALVELQKVDMEIAALRKAAEVYPKQLAELDKELAAAKSAVDAERAKLADLEVQKRTLEQNISDEKDKVKKWEARLTEQRSTREYAALAREIDIAKKTNQNMAEEVVELGKQATAQREVLKGKDGEFAARQDQIGGKMADLKSKLGGVETQAKELEGKRASAAAGVDANLLRRYESVKKKKLPGLVSVLAPGTCQGCNMNVPPQLYNTLRSTLGTDVCPSCHRIICAAEALEAPPAK